MSRLSSRFRCVARRCAIVSFESLALWRVLLGLACVQVVLRRWGMLSVFYTEAGAYPVAAATDQPAWALGPLRWLSSEPALHGAFAICLLIALAFTVGLYARIVKWLLLPVLFSINARTPALFTGGEAVLHLQALYATLLPIGRVLSLDSWLQKRVERRQDAAQAPTAIQTLVYPLVLLQLAVIYLFNTLAKSGQTWQDGTAVAHALGSATLVTHFGAWLATAPEYILRALTRGTLIIEGGLPFLLLSPWYRRYTHALAAALIIALHGGILLALDVGSFSVAMISHVPLLLHRRASEARVEVPTNPKRRSEALIVAVLTYLMVARLGQDLVLFPDRPRPPLPAAINRVTAALGLWQAWMMFSPDPPGRDYVIVTDAMTRSGHHFDPWRQVASGRSEPYKVLPLSVVRAHAFTRYENALSTGGAHSKMHPFFARWVLAQHWGDDPVERFDAWLMIIPTNPRYVVPEGTLDARLGLMPLPGALRGALPIANFKALGVWAPERALDGKIVPEGGYATSVSANMSAGCPSLTLDLGEPHQLQRAFFQADSADHYLIEGSLDDAAFRPLGEMPRLKERMHRSRMVSLLATPVRFVRVRPAYSRAFRHNLSEVALFDHVVGLPELPLSKNSQFFASLARPSVVGIVSGSNHPSPDCPAEAHSGPPATN